MTGIKTILQKFFVSNKITKAKERFFGRRMSYFSFINQAKLVDEIKKSYITRITMYKVGFIGIYAQFNYLIHVHFKPGTVQWCTGKC